MDDRRHKKIFKRKMESDKSFLQKWSEKVDHDKVLEKSEECT